MPRKAAPTDGPTAPARRSSRIKDIPKPADPPAKKPAKPKAKKADAKDGDEKKPAAKAGKKRKADEINGDGEESKGEKEEKEKEEPAAKKVRFFHWRPGRDLLADCLDLGQARFQSRC